MPGLIITGNIQHRDGYIEEIITTHQIAPYNQYLFSEPFKIANARSIRQTLATTRVPSLNYLVVIKSGITIEAQNALLKLLEEIDENVFFVFSVDTRDDLLDTICSRCQIISFHRPESDTTDVKVQELIQVIVNAFEYENTMLYTHTIYQLGEYMEGKSNSVYEDVIVALRKQMVTSTHLKHNTVMNLVGLIERLNAEYSFIVKNNGNKRMAVEYVGVDVMN